MRTRKVPHLLLVVTFLAGFGLLVVPSADAADPAEFQVNTYSMGIQTDGAVSMSANGDFVAIWRSFQQDGSETGVYAQRYGADGLTRGGEFRVNSYTESWQDGGSVAMDDDGDFVVAWYSSGQDGSHTGIYAQRYASDGTVQGPEFQVNTHTVDSQSIPSVGMGADGDFVVVWQSYLQDGSEYGIYGQRYARDGTPLGPEFRVNTRTKGWQTSAEIGMDDEGDFVVLWVGRDESGHGIFAQRYAADGTPQGTEFRVNTSTSNDQIAPAVAMDADGDFVVTWSSNGQDGSRYGVFGQRYRGDGTSVGGEFPVNTYTLQDQVPSDVAMDADGDFVVTWSSKGQDGSHYGVYGQRYDSSGTPVGGEFQAHTSSGSSETLGAVAMDADGNFVATWTVEARPSGERDVFARRFSASV